MSKKNKNRRKKKRNRHSRSIEYYRKKIKKTEAKESLRESKDELFLMGNLYFVAQIVLALILVIIIVIKWNKGGIVFEDSSLAERFNNAMFYVAIAIPGLTMAKQAEYLKKNDLVSETVRSSWRKVIISFLACLIIMFASRFLSFNYLEKINLSIYAFTFFVGLLIMHQSFVVYGFSRPSIIFNRISVSIISSIKLSASFCTFYVFIGLCFPDATMNSYNFLLSVFVVIISNIGLSFFIHVKSQFSSVNQILKYAEINKIRLAISKYSNSRLAKLRADNEFNRLMELGDYAFLQELTRKVNKQNENSKQKNIISVVLFGIFVFIFASVGEGLVQDLLNDRIKELVCSSIGVFCN